MTGLTPDEAASIHAYAADATWRYFTNGELKMHSLLILHKPVWRRYRWLNGYLGAKRTASYGANAWDCDTTVTADDVQMSNHWPALWRDGYTKDLSVRIQHITYARAAGLGIPSVHSQLNRAQRHGVTPCFEIKDWSRKSADRMIRGAKQREVPLVVMAAADQPHLVEALRYFHKHGAITILLARGVVPAEWASFLSYVKGSARACRNLPWDHPRIGIGPSDATRHGCGVTVWNVKAAKRAVLRCGGTL